MPSPVTSLFWISLCAVVAPLLAGLVPRRLVSEVVLLLVLGVLVGPYGAGLAATGDAIGLLRELGLAMLFLLAGFEIDRSELTGSPGRLALLTWLVSLLTAFGLTTLLDVTEIIDSEVALTIALTSTALGTLLPILKDSGLLRGRVGMSVLRHGAYGELGPIVAIAVLLGTSGPAESVLLLAAFGVVALLLAVPSARLRHRSPRLLDLIAAGAETTGQTPVRLTMLLLTTLVAVAAALRLDVVLAAFAAGFILRLALPDGDERLETRIEGIAFGLLVPIFFVTSGMALDPAAIAERPLAFLALVGLILLSRGVPVLASTRFEPAPVGRGLPGREGLAVALFASTGLPIIVAVTSVAVTAGEMSSANASLLVGAGAATVLVCPLAASLVLGRGPAADVRAAR
ncbi:cation:proton antiporter [Nocardioides euryhalodurans]|uniref:Cation:proton antiporter n=1 Tax=Nocardioides euryhalodurans TaxID=2518370 RepID=A0A4P7GIY8_9ACTN|nr:cation:proton antiporter [Nocardioides euryhalodurans]QBR91697.1 cation:proton antiporter [Nocardioides euryhalodurans]